jgi:hypothetical protein
MLGEIVTDIVGPANSHHFRRKQRGEVVLSDWEGEIAPSHPIHVLSMSILEHQYFRGAIALIVPANTPPAPSASATT